MWSVLAPAISAITGVIPSLFSMWKDSREHKYKMEMLKHTTEYQRAIGEQKLAEVKMSMDAQSRYEGN